jgi:ribonucleoside-diphosphate reductase alpha chain
MGIDPNYCPQNLLQAACNTWDRALQKGEQYGYRNAQASVLAPTGTIGLLMDCDTTGVEPDFALVKFKKLSGGGYFKIINQSIPPALRNLGYTEAQINDIIHYVKGHTTLEGAPYINAQTLKAKGLNDRDIQKIEQSLDAAFDIRFSFNPFTLGQEAMQRLGFSADEAMRMDINLLAELGFSEQEIESANEYICGTMSIEGAPHLLEAHYPVFDCANRCGKYGKRFIAPEGHIRMMAAAQPFISGAISKTINLPNEASWEDIQDCYKLGWELGVKALSIYRDGSKLSQPLSSVKTAEDEEDEEEQATAQAEAGQQPASTIADSETARKVIELSQEQLLAEVQKILKDEEDTEQFHKQLKRIVNRRELPNRRRGITQKSKVGGQTIFVRTGEYEDGSLGEIFVDMHKEGATMRSLLNCFAISVSIGLQYGVPLEEFVDKFAFTRFEPAGQVFLHDNIKSATSIVDYIFRHLAMLYLDRDDLVQIPPAKDVGTPQPGDTAAEPGQQLAPNNGGPSNASAANSPAPRGTNGHSAEAKSGEQATSQQNLMSSLMGDAPGCDVCGHITVRSGTCYKCLNCGNSMGCS